MMVCLVVLRASGRGGFVGLVGLDPGFVVGVDVVVRVGAGCVVDTGCFPQRRRVTGINADVADAYEIGALLGA